MTQENICKLREHVLQLELIASSINKILDQEKPITYSADDIDSLNKATNVIIIAVDYIQCVTGD